MTLAELRRAYPAIIYAGNFSEDDEVVVSGEDKDKRIAELSAALDACTRALAEYEERFKALNKGDEVDETNPLVAAFRKLKGI